VTIKHFSFLISLLQRSPRNYPSLFKYWLTSAPDPSYGTFVRASHFYLSFTPSRGFTDGHFTVRRRNGVLKPRAETGLLSLLTIKVSTLNLTNRRSAATASATRSCLSSDFWLLCVKNGQREMQVCRKRQVLLAEVHGCIFCFYGSSKFLSWIIKIQVHLRGSTNSANYQRCLFSLKGAPSSRRTIFANAYK
jgi:hypothetical protein